MLGLLTKLVLLAGYMGTARSEDTGQPDPSFGHFYVKNERGAICLLLDVSATFHVEYLKTDNTTDTVSYPLPNNSYATGTCAHGILDQNKAVVNITFNHTSPYLGRFGVTLTFSRNFPMTHFWISEVTAYYQLIPSVFPSALNVNKTLLSNVSGLQKIKTPSTALTPHSYICKRDQVFVLSHYDVNFPLRTNITVHSIRAQPFDVDSKGTFSRPEECPQDHDPTTEPPSTTPFHTVTPSFVLPVGHFSLRNSKGQVCLLANLGVLFRVKYRAEDGKNRNATYVLPANSSVGGSCDEKEATLSLMFTNTFNLSLSFYTDGKRFILNSLVVGYQRNARFFPDAQEPNTSDIQVENDMSLFDTEVGKSYRCSTQQNLRVGKGVRLEIVELHVQPFGVEDGQFSDAVTCPQDLLTTVFPILNATTVTMATKAPHTLAPAMTLRTTDATTTIVPATTILPSSVHSHTTHPPYPPTTPPTKPMKPLQGHYVVKDHAGQICLLANMGVQFIVKYVKQDGTAGVSVFNVPVTAIASGTCNDEFSSLTLTFYNATFSLTFAFAKSGESNKGDRYRLASTELSYAEIPAIFPQTVTPNRQRHAANMTLNVFSTDAKKSYRCLADVNVTVTRDVTMLVRQVQLQPFHVNKSGKFVTAEDCEQSSFVLLAVVLGSTLPVAALTVAIVGCICWRKRRRRTREDKEPLFQNFIE